MCVDACAEFKASPSAHRSGEGATRGREPGSLGACHPAVPAQVEVAPRHHPSRLGSNFVDSVSSTYKLLGWKISGSMTMAGKNNQVSSEKAMAPHSSTLAWKIPWTEEPGRLQSMGSRRVGHD